MGKKEAKGKTTNMKKTKSETNIPLFLAAPLISPISVGHRRQSGKINDKRLMMKCEERN